MKPRRPTNRIKQGAFTKALHEGFRLKSLAEMREKQAKKAQKGMIQAPKKGLFGRLFGTKRA